MSFREAEVECVAGNVFGHQVFTDCRRCKSQVVLKRYHGARIWIPDLGAASEYRGRCQCGKRFILWVACSEELRSFLLSPENPFDLSGSLPYR